MFVTNINDFNIDSSIYYICDRNTANKLIKNGFCLFSAIYDEDKYFFIKNVPLLNFLENGGEHD